MDEADVAHIRIEMDRRLGVGTPLRRVTPRRLLSRSSRSFPAMRPPNVTALSSMAPWLPRRSARMGCAAR